MDQLINIKNIMISSDLEIFVTTICLLIPLAIAAYLYFGPIGRLPSQDPKLKHLFENTDT